MTTSARLTLPAQPGSVSAARRFVAEMLVALDAAPASDNATALVSELATNAVLHARTPFTIEVVLEGDAVRIGVIDESLAVPRVRDYGDTATTGRGMRLVDALASRWGILRSDHGKTVWFEVPAQVESDVLDSDSGVDAEVLVAEFVPVEGDGQGVPEGMSRAA